MRRRLAALFILSSAAAGCSLLVDFDRDKIPSLADLEDAAADVSVRDGQVDAPGLDGTVDAPIDSTVIDATITGDAGDAGDAADARITVDASDAGDAAVDARDAADGNVAADAADAADSNVADSNVADSNVAVDAADAADAASADADDGSSTADADDGSTADADDGSTADADDGASADANTSTKCSVFTDLTGQTTVAITFPTVANSGQYSPNCIRVSAGTTVTFTGNFAFHPLTRAGVALNSPIPVTTVLANDAGPEGDVAITFPNPGIFDYQCGFHGSVMFGGVQVVP